MAHQIIYTDIPQQQIYTQNPNLVQYNIGTNLQGQFALGEVQYNVTNLPAQVANNQPIYTNINYDPTQLYQQNIQQPTNQQYIYQQQIKQNIQQYQNQIQMKAQPQIANQNYHNHNEPRAQINPQQQTQNFPAKQKIQLQLKPQVQAMNQQQSQPKIYSSPELNYMKYVQKYPNQNANQKINIEYNKKDEHFVNKPIYQKKEKEVSSNQNKIKAQPKKLKTLDDTPTLIQGTKMINLNMKSNLNKQKNQRGKNPQKAISPKLLPTKKEETNIAQNGFANK